MVKRYVKMCQNVQYMVVENQDLSNKQKASVI